jgi:hypothetical protein
MGIEPTSEAWEASGDRNFYPSIQAYVPSPLISFMRLDVIQLGLQEQGSGVQFVRGDCVKLRPEHSAFLELRNGDTA